MVNYEKAQVHRKATSKLGKGVATNKNGLGVELNTKNFKAWSCKIGVVVLANKVAHPWVEKSDFLHMNSRLMSRLGKGDLELKVRSNTIY